MEKSVNLVWFQTTAGHHGRKSLYLNTLNSLKRSISLGFFKYKFLSLKVFNNDNYEEILNNFESFEKFLWLNNDKRINDESTFKDYPYYLLNNYLADICNFYLYLSKEKYAEYTYLVEDDSPAIINQGSLEDFISTAIDELEKDSNLFCVRLKRELEFKENLDLSKYPDDKFIERSTDNNFQNQVFRTEDMIKAAKIISANYESLRPIHTETAVRMALSRVNKDFSFLVLNPKICHSIHTGTSDAEKWIESYGLQVQ